MTETLPHLHIVLLCDVSGVQLWPVVPEGAPACLAPVEPGSSESLLAASLRRVQGASAFPAHLVTDEAHARFLEDALLDQPELADYDVDMLVEPVSRGSAFAIALAAARIRRKDPAAVVLALPANVRIAEDDRWQHLVYRSYIAALQDSVVLVGARQELPCDSYAHIRPGMQHASLEGTFEVRSFSADAPALVAKRARREGAVWYTGIFAVRAAVLMGEFARVGELGTTDAARNANRIAETANFFSTLGVSDLLKDEAREVVEAMPHVPFEKAVLAGSDKLLVLPTTIPMDAVTGLSGFMFAVQSDTADNRVSGPVHAEECRNATVYAPGADRTVAVLGMKDCVVVDTGEVLLVADKAFLERTGSLPEVLGSENEPAL